MKNHNDIRWYHYGTPVSFHYFRFTFSQAAIESEQP